MTVKAVKTDDALLKSVGKVVGLMLKDERESTDKALADVVGKLHGAQSELQETLKSALKAERSSVDYRIDKLQKRIDNLDGAVLLKSTAAALLDAGLAALTGYADAITLKKSVKVRGELPPIVRGLVD